MFQPTRSNRPRSFWHPHGILTFPVLCALIAFLTIGAVDAATQTALTDGLVAHWSFDRDFTAQAGGAAYDGVETGATIDPTEGRFGGSAFFERANGDFIAINAPVITQGQDHTYSVWFLEEDGNVNNGDTETVLQTTGFGGSDAYSCSFGVVDPADEDGDLLSCFSMWPGGSGSMEFGPYSRQLSWNNVIVTYDADNEGAEHSLYFNGVYKGSMASSGTLMDTVGLLIGRSRPPYTWHWDGWIDEVGFWERVLTEAEISVLQYSPIETEEPNITLTLDIQATIPYASALGSGEAYCFLGAGHTTLKNPVIVVEGFDPDNSTNAAQIYELLKTEGLLPSMQAEGYDAVILNFDEGADYIQRNAMVLVELIQRLRDRIPERNDMVVIGASMGGLVSRYALAYMEHNGMEHGVRTFISFDSPQKVANIPIGIQGLVKWITEETLGLGRDQGQDKLNMLRTPAARQMLGWHIDSSIYGTQPLRQQLYTELASLGGYPHALRKVAIANGSGTTLDQGFGDAARLLHYEFPGPVNVFYFGVYALPGPVVFRIEEFGINFNMLTISQGATSWDRAPGGFRNTAEQAGRTFSIDLGIYEIDSGEIFADQSNHCFIPTISAFDLATSDPFFDIAGADAAGTLLGMTPFDAVYYPAENQDHVSITADNKIWFMNEIRKSPEPSGVGDLPYAVAALPNLRAPYPNPFNPRTKISYDLPRSGVAKVEVFDVAGRRVATLADGFQPAGSHFLTWEGRDGRGRDVAAGVYFCRLSVGHYQQVQRMTLIK